MLCLGGTVEPQSGVHCSLIPCIAVPAVFLHDCWDSSLQHLPVTPEGFPLVDHTTAFIFALTESPSLALRQLHTPRTRAEL